MDTMLTLLGVAGVNFVMGVPGADDIMLGYQSTSFHDALYLRQALSLKRAPEFESWLERIGITDEHGTLRRDSKSKLQTYQAQIEAEASLNQPQTRVPQISLLRSQPDHNSRVPHSSKMSGVSPNPDPPENKTSLVTPNPWQQLRTFTHARIALGRTGDSLPTQPALAFQLAHAEARDAVHHALDLNALTAALTADGFHSILVETNAPDRTTYLQQPSFGRTLSPASRDLLTAQPSTSPDLVFVIADGLSPLAIEHHAPALLGAFRQLAPECKLAPLVIATQARVAIGDEIGELLGAASVAVVIGERPGLSSPDSLGIYLTWKPRTGLTDADRNCISNIHARGLSPEHAAEKLAALLRGARRLGVTGTQLHDEIDQDGTRIIGS
jgi:ethanolamine ammonia-lyase small subunit